VVQKKRNISVPPTKCNKKNVTLWPCDQNYVTVSSDAKNGFFSHSEAVTIKDHKGIEATIFSRTALIPAAAAKSC
jgi:hypothetical protein